MSDYCIRIKGDVLVNVPPTLRSLTTWVLLEQEDWFEKEIKFVRRWLQPGMRALDIGANVGVYALTMAKLVAPGGAVWAFEPAEEPAALLQQSIARNELRNLSLLPMALSARAGRATFHVNAQSELNSLVHVRDPHGARAVEVEVSTLDRQQAECHWGAIDFVKIDAEGAEQDILAGGEAFFAAQSPLVMFEVDESGVDGDGRSTITAFRRLGFDIYRLVGPDLMLVPFLPDEHVRRFDINLFACKGTRTAQLADAGLLASSRAQPAKFPDGGGQARFARQHYAPAFGALHLPAGVYRGTLDAYAAWRDVRSAPNLRYAALCTAYEGAREAVGETPSSARLATLARLALETGERDVALEALIRALTQFRNAVTRPEEPFFPPASRYDGIDPGDRAGDWFVAASIEALESTRTFSGYFVPVEAQVRDMLDWLQATPFASAPMERRRQLQRWLAGLQPGLQAAPILAHATPDHLNPDIWMRR